jgi:hypothetical protein
MLPVFIVRQNLNIVDDSRPRQKYIIVSYSTEPLPPQGNFGDFLTQLSDYPQRPSHLPQIITLPEKRCDVQLLSFLTYVNLE